MSDIHEQLSDFNRGPGTTAFKLRAPTRQRISHWFHASWESITRATILSGFQRPQLINDNGGNVPIEPSGVGSVCELVSLLSRVGIVGAEGNDVRSEDDIDENRFGNSEDEHSGDEYSDEYNSGECNGDELAAGEHTASEFSDDDESGN